MAHTHFGEPSLSLHRLLTYHFIRPRRSLCLQLGTITNLQRSRAPTRKEIRDLFPREVLCLFQLNEQRIIFRRELELGTFRTRCRFRHACLPNNTGRAMIGCCRRLPGIQAWGFGGRRLIRQAVMMVMGLLLRRMLRDCRNGILRRRALDLELKSRIVCLRLRMVTTRCQLYRYLSRCCCL